MDQFKISTNNATTGKIGINAEATTESINFRNSIISNFNMETVILYIITTSSLVLLCILIICNINKRRNLRATRVMDTDYAMVAISNVLKNGSLSLLLNINSY